MAQLSPYLFFDGNCAEAMRFYERLLDGKLETMMKHSDAPMVDKGPPGSGDRILHAHLAFPGGVLLASDGMVGQPQPMKGIRVSVFFDTVEQARKVWEGLAAGAQIDMPFEKTFWAKGFGMLTDRFGTPWMVSGGQAT
jgi:PhnB protein